MFQDSVVVLGPMPLTSGVAASSMTPLAPEVPPGLAGGGRPAPSPPYSRDHVRLTRYLPNAAYLRCLVRPRGITGMWGHCGHGHNWRLPPASPSGGLASKRSFSPAP